MHVPDGFLGPQTWLPAAGAATAAWAWSLRRLRSRLRAETIPALGVTTACCFGLMLIAVPLPLGGASIHATGVAVLALRFGVSTAFPAVTIVLSLQALLLGDGGVPSLPVTSLALGLGGGGAAVAVRRGLARLGPATSRFAAGWASVMTSALLTGLALGLQPVVATDAAGEPLFFPFGWSTVLPALLVPHAVLGLLEGAVTSAALARLGEDDA